MSLRRKNLLEAFRQSDAQGTPPAADPPPHEAAPPRATLFDAPAARPGFPAPALVLIGLVVAFVLGYLTGRAGHGESRAGEAGSAAPPVTRTPPAAQPRAFQERPPVAEAPAVADPRTQRLEDSALFAAENLQTIVVASYGKSNQDLAWATYQHLRDANLPVFPPVESRNLLVVLAGAAPTTAELQKTLTAVKALSRDGKKKDYSDAYTARIDTLIPRPKK